MPNPDESLSFDRVASVYDATRGGVERGRLYAPAIARSLRADVTIVELGVGTGAIALPLMEMGRRVVGFDLSMPMINQAFGRIGPAVSLADAHRLPLADGSVQSVLTVWLLHLVADPAAVVQEIARVLARDGRWCAIAADAVDASDNDPDAAAMAKVLHELNVAVGRFRDAPTRAADWATAAGLRLVEESNTEWATIVQSPAEAINYVQTRTSSSYWNLTDADFTRVVQPHLDRLWALPSPRRPRRRRVAHPVQVFER